MKIIQIGLAAVGASSAVAFAPISKHESNSYTKTAIRMDTEEGESVSFSIIGWIFSVC